MACNSSVAGNDLTDSFALLHLNACLIGQNYDRFHKVIAKTQKPAP
jgi:hypothetical protein